MPLIPLSFLSPKNWQDFEQLTKDVAKYRLDSDFDLYGRAGQKQSGVDLFGWDRNNKATAIQCKHKKSAAPKSKKIHLIITKQIIDDEVKKSDSFNPKLERFIIATTSFRDTKLQDHINKFNQARKAKNLSTVEVWFWETFEEELNNHSELAYLYYGSVLRSHNRYDKDKHILYLLRRSLKRPAFNTHFNTENNTEDFLQAIKDTQKAFNTGKLYDREGNLVGSAYSAEHLSRDEDKKVIANIEIQLQKIRDYTTDQIRKGNIKQRDNFLEFPLNWESRVADFLNDSRSKILTEFNDILKGHKIETISSQLI